jgi:hypothetical protein
VTQAAHTAGKVPVPPQFVTSAEVETNRPRSGQSWWRSFTTAPPRGQAMSMRALWHQDQRKRSHDRHRAEALWRKPAGMHRYDPGGV